MTTTSAHTSQARLEQLDSVYGTVSRAASALADGQFHQCYWYGPHDPTPTDVAAHRITDRICIALGLRAGDRLLDAGSGPGASSCRAAHQFGAVVHGVTASRWEVETARARAADLGISGTCTFERGDYTALDHPDGSFDHVMAVESLLCSDDLTAALAELNRVTAPGGCIAVCHPSRAADLPTDEAEAVRTTIGAVQLLSTREWADVLTAAGFAVEETCEFGPRTVGLGPKALAAARERWDDIVTSAGEEPAAGFFKGMEAFYANATAALGYGYLVARKPR